ncbi:hypothetical protein C8R44DRAFT_814455 [Mycena epipterygia]|nr:hypothetical protein C8R44DRAFT_814455 [Mycena epipterygia]
MPAALRSMSSAPSTPRASTTRTNTPLITDSESPATPRKPPHCKTCGRPRKGHLLSACEPAGPSPKKTNAATETPTKTLIDSLAAMELADRDQKDKRERRRSVQPRPLQSLPSISTITGELLDSLKAPGLLDDDGSEYGGDDAEKREVVIRWRQDTGKGDRRVDASVLPLVPTPPSIVERPTLLPDESTPTKKRAGK